MRLFCFFSALSFVALISSSAWAKPDALAEFFKQYPKACKQNTTALKLNAERSPLVAVLKCLDAKEKELSSCRLSAACDRWFFEVYRQADNRYELLQKSVTYDGDRPQISVKKDVVSVRSAFRVGSSAREEDKFRLEGDKLRLIGFEYSIVFNGQLVNSEDDPYASDFSVNTLTGRLEQTDHFAGPKSKKTSCKMPSKFKNLTLSDSIDTSIESLACDTE